MYSQKTFFEFREVPRPFEDQSEVRLSSNEVFGDLEAVCNHVIHSVYHAHIPQRRNFVNRVCFQVAGEKALGKALSLIAVARVKSLHPFETGAARQHVGLLVVDFAVHATCASVNSCQCTDEFKRHQQFLSWHDEEGTDL